MSRYLALSRLLSAVLRSFRALLWSALLASAHAQLVPPLARRSELDCPNGQAPAAPNEKLTTAPLTWLAEPRPARQAISAPDFTHGLFKYLAAPKPEEQSRNSNFTTYAGLIISDGQILELHGDLNAALGTSPGQISWAGSGGFAAYGFDRTVRIGSSSTPIIWGATEHFIGTGDVLVFGSAKSDATVIWDTKIDLGGGERTIRLIEGLEKHTRAVVRFDRGFINGDLIFERDETSIGNALHVGRADLSATNDDWQGNLTVRGTDVRANLDASLRGLHSITIEGSGRFTIDNFGTNSESWGGRYLENRLSQFTTINLNSGTLAYWGREWGKSAERTGIVELLGGANVIDVNSGGGQASILTIGGLYRSGGATLNLISSNSLGSGLGTGGNTPQIKFRDQAGPWAMPALEGDIIPWMTVNGTDFATLKGKHLVAYTAYHTGSAHDWNAKTNASPNTDQYLSTNRTVNSLRLDGGRHITLYGNTKLTLNTGAILSTGAPNKYNSIKGGELAIGGTGPRELYAHTHNGGWLAVTSNITKASNGAPIGLIKTGKGALSLTGHNLSALTGEHHINDGSLWLRLDAPGLGLGGHVIVGNHGLNFTNLIFSSTGVIQRSTRITLRGAHVTTLKSSIADTHRSSSSALHITSGTENTLESLTIDDSGLLFFGGSSGLLAFDHITMADSASELFIGHWLEAQTHLLIARAAGAEIAKYLAQIKFIETSGAESPAHLIDYDSKYFEIVPTWYTGSPEPSTTGALLGAGALGFYAWRRRRVAKK